MSQLTTGEVTDVILTDDTMYAIRAKIKDGSNITDIYYPLDVNIKKIPVKGDVVLITPSINAEGEGGSHGGAGYYTLVSTQKNINNNVLPDAVIPKSSDSDNQNYQEISAGNQNVGNVDDGEHDMGEGFEDDENISPLQPFLGDVLIEGRFGHSLRFGYTPQTSQTTKTPSWSSNNDTDPITILSNGRGTRGEYNKFIIEDIDDDLSSIWMTSTQKIRLSTSQTNLGRGVESPAQYDNASIILNSDRILLNAKSDYIILSADKGVNIASSNWAMDLDKLFTEIQNLVNNVIDLNDNVQKAHDEIARLAQSTATMTLTGNLGSPVPVVSAPVILLSKGFSQTNKTLANNIKTTANNIKQNIDNMKQS